MLRLYLLKNLASKHIINFRVEMYKCLTALVIEIYTIKDFENDTPRYSA